MTTDEFRAFVRANEEWFRGRLPETEESLSSVESSLGVRLPQSMRWLLKEYGYWHATGISNLADSVKDTLAARTHYGLPHGFVVLENLQDAGLILIDTADETSPGEPAFYWVGAEDLAAEPRLDGNQRFPSYGEYAADRLESERDFYEERDVRYDPRDFPEGRGGA
jgi:hypothetical protein